MHIKRGIFVFVIVSVFILFTILFVRADTISDSTSSNFNNGTYFRTFYNSSGFVQLNYTFTTGSFTSRVLNSAGLAQWNNFSWIQGANYSGELPNDGFSESNSLFANPMNMTGNVLLMHFNNLTGENATRFKDFSGLSNNGSCPNLNQCPLFNISGKFAGSMYFDGQSTVANRDRIVITSASSLAPTNFLTWEVWTKWYGQNSRSGDNDLQNIFTNGDPGRALRVTEPTHFINGGSRVLVWLDNNTILSQTYSNIQLKNNTWYHLAVTYNGSEVRLYINGNLDSVNNSISGSLISQNIDSYVGLEQTDYPFYGLVDELAVYNRSLSAQEVRDRYTKGIVALNLSVRSCDDSLCSGESFTQIGFTSHQGLNSSGIINNPYFQYQFNFSTENFTYSPTLYSSLIDYTQLNIAPVLNITSPLNTTYNVAAIDLNYTVFDSSGLDKCWYTKNSGSTNITISCGVNVSAVTANQGSNTWAVYSNDTSGLVNSSLVTFFVDSVIPLISYNGPTLANNSFVPQSFIYVNTSWTEVNFANITFSLYNSSGLVNQTLFTSSTTNLNWTNLGDGTYYFNVTLKDIVGNSNTTQTRTIILNNAVPSLVINSPLNTTYVNSTILVNLTSGGSTTWFFNGTANVTYTIPIFVKFNQGSNKLIGYANDSAGNLNTSSVIFNVDSLFPTINYTTPTSANGSLSRSRSIFVNLTSNDTNFANLSVKLFNESRDLLFNNISLTNILFINYTELTDGIYYFNATSIDSFGNSNSTQTSTVTIDGTAPGVTIFRPASGETFGTNMSLPLQFSASDFGTGINACWYTKNSGVTNVTLPNCQNATFNVTGNAVYTIIVYANDSAGNVGSDFKTFSVSLGAPSIQVISPISGRYLNYTNVTFLYNSTSVNLQSCHLLGNFTGIYLLNQTVTNSSGLVSGAINNFTLVLDQGVYSWAIFCNDSFANFAVTGNSSLSIDTTSPTISLSAPSGTYSSLTGLPLTFFTSDASPVYCYYNYSLIGNPQSSNFNMPNCTSTTFSVGVFGNYQFYLTVNDSAGNSNFTSNSFIVSQNNNNNNGGGNSGGGGGGGGGSSSSGTTSLLSISPPSKSYIKRGQTDSISFTAKNIGLRFLNRCGLSFGGDLAIYTSNFDFVSLSPGEVHDFSLSLSLPSNLDPGQYPLNVFVNCNESTFNSSFSIAVIPTDFDYRFVKYERSVDEFKIFYTLEEQSSKSQSIVVNYSLKDSKGVEITRGFETISLASLSKNNGSFVLKLPKEAIGEYSLDIIVSNSKENINLQNPVFLSADGVTGFAISDNNLKTLRTFGIFLLAGVILIFVVSFIIRHHNNTKEHPHIHRIKLHRFK